ncbi:MAG TPA: alpha/beta hydrolase [Nitrososphaeraceae archaeon]|nr:alpha/beta hydrolase [Nitrososphaeraceae archaeon]
MILDKNDIGMKKLAFVVISFMTSLLLATMVIVGGIEAVISSGQIMTANNRLAYAAFSSTNLSASITSQSFSLDNIETKKVRVGDIDIAYKIFGKGKPLLLIPGFSMTTDMWDPNVLNRLSSNHTVIVFDNRGIGQTTAGNDTNKFSISQFANDTAGFLAALRLDKSVNGSNYNQPIDILGLSLGGFIAQEFALTYPDKVDRLILVVSGCGGKESIPPQISPEAFRSMVSGNATEELFLSTLFPKKWINENIDYIERNFVFPMGKIPPQNLLLQSQAAGNWEACDRLSNIINPTLIVAGTEDITAPPANSVMMAERIHGAWLIQMRGGGHGLIFQYPNEFSEILETFFHVS